MPDTDTLEAFLEADDAALEARWQRLTAWVQARFDREATLEAVLFLIGIQARGRGFEPELEREAKQDVIMEGTFFAFETLGFYARVGMESNGFWIWEKLVQLPELAVEAQEKLLRLAVLRFFDEHAEGWETADG